MTLSIKQKFLATLAMVVFATALSGLVSLATVRATSSMLQELEEHRLQSLLLARDARASFQRYGKDIEVALSTNEPSILNDDKELIDLINHNLHEYHTINGGTQNVLVADIDAFVNQAQQFLALRTSSNANHAGFVDAGSKLNLKRTELTVALAYLEEQANESFEAHLNGIKQQNRRSNFAVLGLVTVMTAVTVIFSAVILHRVLRRIRRIGLHFVGTDIDKIDALTGEDNADELGELAGAANRMLLGIKDSRRALVDKKLIDSVMEALLDALLVTNSEGVIMRSNRAGAQLLQLSAEQLVGCKLLDLLALDARSKTREPARLLAQVLSQESVTDEFTLKLPGGRAIAVGLIGAPLAGGDAGAAAVFVLHDLTQVRARELELRAVQGQLMQSSKLASLGTLGAGVAHELNNPLTAVLGFAEAISAGGLSPERTQELAAHMIRASLRMRKIIDHLRSFSADTSRQAKKPLSLNQVVNDSLILLNKQFADQRITISMTLDAGLAAISGDANGLESVIQNLLTNARDALADNPPTRPAEIRIATQSMPPTPAAPYGEVSITIEDNGKGIAEADREHIFDPFFTTKEVGKGTGLGLSISHAILQEHQGKLAMRSGPGQGTRFTIAFPALARGTEIAAGAVPRTVKKPDATATPPVKPSRKPTILIIDDEEMVGEVLSMALEQTYDVTYVDRPDLGCERYLNGQFDLLITDVRMPKMNGIEVIQKIRSERPQALILVITGHAKTESEVQQALLAGAFGVIPKPFPKQVDLLKIIGDALHPLAAA